MKTVYSLDSVRVSLRKVSPFLAIFAEQLPPIKLVDEPQGPIALIRPNGQIEIDVRMLGAANTPVPGLNVTGLSLAAKTFILAHEVCHAVLGHNIMHIHPSPSYAAAEQENSYALNLSIETQTNYLATEAMQKYGFNKLVTPIDQSKPVWDMAVLDAEGESWHQIYEKIKHIKPPPTPQMVLCDLAGGSAADTISTYADLTPERISDIIRRSVNHVGLSSIPGTMRDSIADHILLSHERPLPWTTLLRNVKMSVTTTRLSYKRWSKRGTPEILRKGRTRIYTTYNILAYIDTSGSISDEMIGEVLGGLVDSGDTVNVDYCYFDTRVYGIETLDKKTKSTDAKKVYGRGGTDFDVVTEHWANIRTKYDRGVVITDGYATLPSGLTSTLAWVIDSKSVKSGNAARVTPLFVYE